MKTTSLLVLSLMAGCVCLEAQSADTSVGTNGNPLRIAMLRWYQGSANGSTVPLPLTAPSTMVFDGSNIWVGSVTEGLVQVKPGDGLVAASYPIPGVCQLAFDGLNLWSVDCATATLTKIRASTGTVVSTFQVGSQLVGIAYDGANLWVVNQGAQGTVSKVRAADGTILGTFSVGPFPGNAAFDGANIWVVNRAGNTVSKLRASDGAVLGTFATGTNPQGIAFDGQNMWVTNILPPSGVTKIQASDGTSLGFFPLSGNPVPIVFDGHAVWISGGRTYKLSVSSGAVLASFAPTGVLVFDGASIWVASAESNDLSRL